MIRFLVRGGAALRGSEPSADAPFPSRCALHRAVTELLKAANESQHLSLPWRRPCFAPWGALV